MSNRLLNLAKAITTINGRKIHPSEKLVLLALADDARDAMGGRTKELIINRELQERTGLSERAVRMAISALIKAGHISRKPGRPGAAMDTLVHPVPASEQPSAQAIAPAAEVAAKPAAIAGQPATIAGGSYSIRIKDQDNHSPTAARAREPVAVEEVKQPEAAADPVDALFDRWDAMATALKIPGPATRSLARRAAMAARIAEFGAGQMAMAIDTAERKARAGAFRRASGQGDLFLTIDALLGLGNARGLLLLERLLEGDGFGVADGQAAVAGDAPAPVAVASVPGEGPAEAQIRAAAMQQLGRATYQAWLAPARLSMGPDGLTITAASAFAADHISNQIAPQLRRQGMAVRVTRERIGA